MEYSNGIHPVFTTTYRRMGKITSYGFNLWIRNSESHFFKNMDHFISSNGYGRLITSLARQGRMPTPLYGKLLMMLWDGDEEMYNLAKILIDEYEKKELTTEDIPRSGVETGQKEN